MAITPNDKPNQFMFTALPFEGMINQAAQEKRMKDAYEMQMAGQMGKFQGQLMSIDRLENDKQLYQQLLGRSGDRLDQLMKKHPDGFYSPEGTKDFYQYVSSELNDPDYRTLMYNYETVNEDKKAIYDNDELDDMSKKHALNELLDYKTTIDPITGELSTYTRKHVPNAYDRNKSIMAIAEKVPSIKSFIEHTSGMTDDEKVSYIKKEKLDVNDIIEKASGYIFQDPEIQKVGAYRIQNNLQTEEEFKKEILGHLVGAANVLAFEDEGLPKTSGKKPKKKEEKDLYAGRYVSAGGNVSFETDRDLVKDLTGMSHEDFIESDYDIDALIQDQEAKLKAVDAEDVALAEAKKAKTIIDEQLKAYDKMSDMEKVSDLNYSPLISQKAELEKAIKTLSTPKTTLELNAQAANRRAFKANVQDLKAKKILQEDRVKAAIANDSKVKAAQNILSGYIRNVSDEELLDAIVKAAEESKDVGGIENRYGESVRTGYGGVTSYSSQAAAFSEALTSNLGIKNPESISYLRDQISSMKTDMYETMLGAVESANETRREAAEEFWKSQNKVAVGEEYITPQTDKDSRELFGSTVFEDSFFNEAFAKDMDIKNINSSGISYNEIKNNASAKVKFRGQTKTGVVGEGGRRNIIDVTYKVGNKTFTSTFSAKIPDEFKEQSNNIYQRYITKTLTDKKYLTGDQFTDDAVISTAYQLEMNAQPKTDNLWIVDNYDGTESTYKIRYKDDNYTLFTKDEETGKYEPVTSKVNIDGVERVAQLSSKNISDLAYAIAGATGHRASKSPIITGLDEIGNNVLGLVRELESGKGTKNKGYNSIYAKNYDAMMKELGKPITKATVNEIDAAAEKIGKKQTAVGDFQITRDTRDHFFLTNYSKGFTKDMPMDKKMQDAMLKFLLYHPSKGGIETYNRSKKTLKDKEALADRLANVWAAFPGKDGKSKWADVSDNVAGIEYEKFFKRIGL